MGQARVEMRGLSHPASPSDRESPPGGDSRSLSDTARYLPPVLGGGEQIRSNGVAWPAGLRAADGGQAQLRLPITQPRRCVYVAVKIACN